MLVYDQELIDELFDEMVSLQKKKMLELAQIIVPHIVEDDLLQPFDFPELEANAAFRYEEGVMEGMLTSRMALLAKIRQS